MHSRGLSDHPLDFVKIPGKDILPRLVEISSNPVLQSVWVLSEDPDLSFRDLLKASGINALNRVGLVFPGDTSEGFEEKIEFLKSPPFNLSEREQKPGDPRKLYFKLDVDLDGDDYQQVDWDWRVTCSRVDGASKIFFERAGSPPYKEGVPDNMTDALFQFSRKFNPKTTSIHNALYQVEVDYDALIRRSKYPVRLY